MCKQTDPVYIVHDDSLSSERDGSPRIYWTPASTWTAFRGADAIELSWSVVSGDANAFARVYVQTSLDGRTWDESDTGQGGLVSAGIDTNNPNGSVVPRYLGTSSGAAFVRFGVQISNGADASGYGSGPVAMRLTLVATPRQGGGEVVFAYRQQNTSPVAVDYQVGPTLRVVDLDQLTLVAESFGFSPSPPDESITFTIYTGPSPSGPWFSVGNLTVDGATNSTPVLLATRKEQWSTYVQVQVSAVVQNTSNFGQFSLTGTAWKGC